jgi:hypothetical protein
MFKYYELKEIREIVQDMMDLQLRLEFLNFNTYMHEKLMGEFIVLNDKLCDKLSDAE